MNGRFLWWQTLGVLVIVVGVLLLLAVLGVIGSPGQAVGIIFGAIFILMGLYVLLRFRPAEGGGRDALMGSIRRFGLSFSRAPACRDCLPVISKGRPCTTLG